MVPDAVPTPEPPRPGDPPDVEEEFARLLGRLVARRWLLERGPGEATSSSPMKRLIRQDRNETRRVDRS